MCKLGEALNSTDDKFARSNLGRGPRRGAVAHVRHEVPIGYDNEPQIRLQKYHSRGPIPKPHCLLHSWTHLTYDKRHPDPIRRFPTMHWTDRQTERPTDRSRESLTTIGRCATRLTRATRSNKTKQDNVQVNSESGQLLSVSVIIFTARAYARAVLGVVILSVRLSVCHTRGLWQNWMTHCRYFLPHERAIITLLLWYQEWLVGDAPFPLKYAFKVTHPLRKTPTSTDFRA